MNTIRRVALALLVAGAFSCGGGPLVVKAKVASVVVTPSSASISPNATTALSASPFDAQGNVLTGLSVSWLSSNSAVANVSSGGIVTAGSPGSATVTATIGGVQGSAQITVIQSYAIAASASPAGAGTVTGAGSYAANSSASLTATPNPGFAFVNWTEGSTQVSTSATYTFTVAGPHTLVANFVAAFQLAILGGGTGSGVVTSVPAGLNCLVTNGTAPTGGACQSLVAANVSVTLTAAASTGSVFAGWSGACSGTGVCVVLMSQNKSVTASFAPDPCTPVTLAIPNSGSGALSSSSGCVIAGVPTSVYRFSVAAVGSTRFSVTSASFAPSMYVTADPGQNGGFVSYFLSAAGTLTQAWALPPGSYRLYVQTENGVTGSFTESATAVSGDATTGCVAEALTVSVAITGLALNATDCTFSTTNWYFSEYDMYSTLPCTITMSSALFAPAVNLRDVNGNQLGFITTSGAGVSATTSLSSCTASGGPLRILATSSSPGFTGAYTLTVQIQGQAASAATIVGRFPVQSTDSGAPVNAQRLELPRAQPSGIRMPDPR